MLYLLCFLKYISKICILSKQNNIVMITWYFLLQSETILLLVIYLTLCCLLVITESFDPLNKGQGIQVRSRTRRRHRDGFPQPRRRVSSSLIFLAFSFVSYFPILNFHVFAFWSKKTISFILHFFKRDFFHNWRIFLFWFYNSCYRLSSFFKVSKFSF